MKQLRRTKKRKISGVCQGLSNWLNIDVTYIRALFVVAGLVPFVGFLSTVGVYALLAYLIPEEKDYIDI